MRNSKVLLKHAFILDVLCLLLCFALLFLGTKATYTTPRWLLVVGALIALVALVASIWLFAKARKLDREESRRIEKEILDNAAREDAHEQFAEDDKPEAVDNIAAEPEIEQEDYKTDDEE